MTLDELTDETIAVMFQLEVSGCYLSIADDGMLHVHAPPVMGKLNDDISTRLDGVLHSIVAVVAAEQYVREVDA